MPPLGASRVSSTAARPAARTRSLRRCFSDSALSLRNGQARYYCGDGSTRRQWRQHSPASLRQGRPSIAHQLGDQCLHPAFAGGDSSCGHALSRPAGGRNLQEVREGEHSGPPRRQTSRRPAHILMSGVCSGMILCVLEKM
eukprot:scaffold125405_cov62-Phaeocystis_antarctica.AAC.2